MNKSRLERLAPLTGVLGVILIVVAVIVFPEETPDANDPRAKVVAFWLKHDSDAIAASIILTLATIPLLWFAGSLRSALHAAEGGTGRLASIAFGGLIVLVSALVTGAALMFTTADIADNVPPEVLQSVAAVSSDFFFPFLVGVAVFLGASAVAILRHGAMHRAFGWTALIIAIAAITPIGFFGFLASGLWTIAASIALFVREGRAAPAAPTAPATSPGSPA